MKPSFRGLTGTLTFISPFVFVCVCLFVCLFSFSFLFFSFRYPGDIRTGLSPITHIIIKWCVRRGDRSTSRDPIIDGKATDQTQSGRSDHKCRTCKGRQDKSTGNEPNKTFAKNFIQCFIQTERHQTHKGQNATVQEEKNGKTRYFSILLHGLNRPLHHW